MVLLATAKLFDTYDSFPATEFTATTGKQFTDVTRQSGINSSINRLWIGIVVSDINLDGYPDIYIGNDFHENDYLYINQRNGTFRDELKTDDAQQSVFDGR